MKRVTLSTVSVLFLLSLCCSALAQTSGILWIKTFEPGSTSLDDPLMDHEAVAALDELMKDPTIDVTFLGSADSVGWVMNGRAVHTHISEAWNDAKRLGRARALRARYQRGHVGVTHENIAGVKVIWTRKVSRQEYETDITDLKNRSTELTDKVAHLEDEMKKMDPISVPHPQQGQSYAFVEQRSFFDWSLQGGFWTWQSASGGNILSPSISLGIIINNSSFILQGGVTPWHNASPEGNQSESFVFVGVKHMKSENFGFSGGVFRGWEFFTATDDWTFKTTGLSTGVVVKNGILEFNPTITYSHSDSIFEESKWKIGTTLGLSINFNEAF